VPRSSAVPTGGLVAASDVALHQVVRLEVVGRLEGRDGSIIVALLEQLAALGRLGPRTGDLAATGFNGTNTDGDEERGGDRACKQASHQPAIIQDQ
jgi:hypothetical protein